MPDTIRVRATSDERSQAMLATLDGVGGVAFSHDGIQEVHIRLDAATSSSLVQLLTVSSPRPATATERAVSAAR